MPETDEVGHEERNICALPRLHSGHDGNALRLVEGDLLGRYFPWTGGVMELSGYHGMTIADYAAISVLVVLILLAAGNSVSVSCN